MGDQGEDTRFYRVLVAIETDATRYYGAHASRPRTPVSYTHLRAHETF